MRVGVLTGGGDCPGLNAVIRAAVRVGASEHGHEHVGLKGGWRGLLRRETVPLDRDIVGPILPRGGTILGSSRTNPFKDEGGGEECRRAFADLGLDALIAIGGEDTLGVARRLAELGLPVVGVPKTIDNDLSGTDFTFGFWTAVQIATDAIDRLHTTAESHDRVIVCEVMGRHAGWIALESATAGGAHAVLIPEQPVTVQAVCDRVLQRRARGKGYAIIVVSEGVVLGDEGHEGELDEFGHAQLAKVGVAERLAVRISEETGAEARPVVLGHVQRGGSPVAFDRVLATRYGTRAAGLVAEAGWGRMVAILGNQITDIPLSDAVSELKTVPESVWRAAEAVVAGP
ncbi:MAG: 6-phosphofructokinase [Thermoleophilia bacterium]